MELSSGWLTPNCSPIFCLAREVMILRDSCNAMTSRARQAREIWTQQLPDLCGIGSPSWADVWSCSTLSTVTCLSTRGQKFSEGTHEVACTKRRCFIASEPSVWEGSSFRLKIAAAQLPRPVLANSCWFLWQTVGFTGGTKTMARFFPAFAHPPCAASLQIIAALPHNPNASQFCSVNCTSLTAAKSQMNGTGIGTGCWEFQYCIPSLWIRTTSAHDYFILFLLFPSGRICHFNHVSATHSLSLSLTLFNPLSHSFFISPFFPLVALVRLLKPCSSGNVRTAIKLYDCRRREKAARQANTWHCLALPSFLHALLLQFDLSEDQTGNTVRH